MSIGSCLQELGTFLADCERHGDAISDVEVTATGDGRNGGFSARLELRVPVDLAEACKEGLCDPRIGSDGTVRFALESTRDLIPEPDNGVAVEPTDATLTEDGVRVTLTATVQGETTEAGVSRESVTDGDEFDATTASVEPTSDTAPSDAATSRDRGVPPFKDRELLSDVYESHDTFAEMAEALDMDVTAETVRRYMIDNDIHEPNSYQVSDATGPAGEDAQPVVLSDGIGLPDDVTVDALIETVQRSNTIYEVKQDIDVDRQDALEMLQELNLLDLVVGRLATESERDITREDVVDRLRDASAGH
jgi:hypothetical protein